MSQDELGTCRTLDLCVLVCKGTGGDISRRPGISQDEYVKGQVGISRGIQDVPG